MALAVLTVWLASAHAQSSGPSIDLMVASVGLAPGESVPHWEDGVGNAAQLLVNVTNPGTVGAAYRIDFAWVDGDGRTPLNGDTASSFDVSESLLPPKAWRLHRFPWTLQAGQEGAGQVEAAVSITQTEGSADPVDRAPGNNAARRSMFVQARSFSLAIDPTPIDVEADGRTFFRILLHNDGNAPESIALALAPGVVDDRLSAQFTTPLAQLAAHTTGTEALLVTFDPAGDFSSFSQRFGILANPGFGVPRFAESPPVTLATAPGQYGVAVERVGAGEVQLPSGQATPIEFRINNTGDRRDVFRVGPLLPDGWEGAASPSQLALLPGETGTTTVRVRPAESAARGSPGQVSLAVHADLLTTTPVAHVAVRIAGPAPTIASIEALSAVYVGTPATIDVRLANQGDAIASDSPVELLVQSPGSPPLRLNGTVGPIAKSGEAKVTFDLPPPVAGGQLDLVAQWSPPGTPQAVLQAQALVHDVVLRVTAATPAAGAPGETVSYRNGAFAFLVTNDGNAAEDVTFSVVAQGRATVEGEHIARLEPGQSWLVAVQHELPRPAGAATTANVTLQAKAGPVQASNTTGTRIVDVAPPVVDALALPLRWNAAATRPLPLVAIVADDGAVAAVNATVVMPSGGTAVVPLQVGPDGLFHGEVTLVEKGNHTVRFAAVDRAGNRASTAAQKVDATTLPAPAIEADGLGANGTLAGTSLRLKVRSELAVASLHVVLAQGNSSQEMDVPLVGGEALVDISGLQPGPAWVNATATDASGSSGRLATRVVLSPRAEASATSTPSARDAPALGALPAALAAATAVWARGRAITTIPMPHRGIGRWWRMGPRRRAARFGHGALIAAIAALAVLGADLLGGAAPRPSEGAPSPAADLSDDEPRLAAWEASLGTLGLPGLLRPEIGSWAHEGLGDLPPLDVPAAPPGPQPLSEALRAYARSRGLPEADLTPEIEGLGLDPRAEAALSQLVLAFVQASALQQEALAGLTAEELAMFSGAPDAGVGWLDAHPGATLDDLEAHMLDLSASKVDTAKLVQAADLLTRSVEDLRHPLSLPPLPFTPELMHGELPETPWDVIQAATRLPTVAAPEAVTLDAAVRNLATAYGLDAADVPSMAGLLHPTLDGAIALIVDAHAAGVSSADPAAHAATVLAAAEAAAPTLQAWEAIFALEANGAAPDIAGLLTEAIQAVPSPVALAAAARGRQLPAPPAPQSLQTLLGSYGLSQREAAAAAAALPPDAAAALALILTAEAGLLEARADLDAAVGPRAALALQLTPVAQDLSRQTDWTPWEAAVVQEWAGGLAQAPPELLDRLADAQWEVAAAAAAAAELLRPLQAPAGIAGPGLPNPSVPTPCAGPFSDCANDILLEIEAGSGILVTGSGRSTVDGSVAGGDPHIILDLGGDDVYTVSAGASANGFGLPGRYGGQQLDSLLGEPLGAGYIYGPWDQETDTTLDHAADGRFLGILIDRAGNDVYRSAAVAGQGSAIGLGTIGILWDRAGDDLYRQEPGDVPVRAFQGTGGSGGLGLLVDEQGADRYEAVEGVAQGAGIAPIFRIAGNLCLGISFCTGMNAADRDEVTGAGALVDLGAGDDSFTAFGGQGHADGYGSVGVLYDDAGRTTYAITPASLKHQGGRGATSAGGTLVGAGFPTPSFPRGGGLAALIDLGGPGDAYNAPDFPASGAAEAADLDGGWLVRPSEAARKADNVLWAETRAGIAFGLDSSLEDEDADTYSSLLELLVGSDPADRESMPAGTLLGTAAELEEQARGLAALVLNATSDRDGDSYPDTVETAAGSEPDDPNSTPGLLNDPGFILTLAVLCPTDNATCATPCDGGATCVSLLSIGGPGTTRHARPSIVEFDLEGDDLYVGPVAGPGTFATPNGPQTAGSLSIDVGGNDSYDTPDLAKTQAYASSGASLLLDLAGQDIYRARQEAQGASAGAIAILADFQGGDHYESGASSQGDYAGLPTRAGAALIDLAGDDSYQTATQASLRSSVGAGTSPFAILLDAAGIDAYAITSPGTTPFDRQGRVTLAGFAGATGVSNTGTLARALFMDVGDENDTYLDLSGAAPVDESQAKNGAFLREDPGPVGSAIFSDGLREDDDEDGFPPIAEALAGSDPKNPASTPDADGRVRMAPGRGTGLRLPGLTIGGVLDDTYLARSDFMVDLGGDDHYLAKFIGGTAPGLHGLDVQPFTASLVLDVGGDDEYRPEPCVIEPAPYMVGSVRTIEPSVNTAGALTNIVDSSPGTQGSLGSSSAPTSAFEPRQFLFCPSLGAAALGVAVLGDQGGQNTFDASIRVRITVDAKTPSGASGNSDVHVRTWGLSQGAALFNGVGVLATWDGENTLGSDVDLTVEEKNSQDQDPAADAYTLSQGASYGSGAGLLLASGGGDDSYSATARARAPWPAGRDGGRERAYAQGAAMGGLGMLVDDGGDNRFSAPDGFAQAFAFRGSMGLLWSGAGDDDYLGGSGSQGAAGTELQSTGVPTGPNSIPIGAIRANPSLAGLVDQGGNDRYLLAPIPPGGQERNSSLCPVLPRPDCALAQGAADLGGVALLADWAGDDLYDATGRSYVQGAGRIAGHATLFDASGNDVYRALSDGQGFAEATGAPSSEASGTLLDLAGRDTYDLGLRGQGYSTSPRARALLLAQPAPGGTIFPFDEAAQFIDLGGQDVYRYGMAKAAVPAGSEPTADGNRWQWTQQPADATFGSPRGLGIDAEGLDEAVAMYQQGPAPSLADVEICLREAGSPDCFAEGPERLALRGTVEAVVTATPGPGLAIKRVSVLRDGTTFGIAQPSLSIPGTFVLPWDTRLGSPDGVADGTYRISAVAWVASVADAGADTATPDGLPVESPAIDADVDNPPLGELELTESAVSPNVTATAAFLRVKVGADVVAPDGARVRVTLAGPSTATLYDEDTPRGVLEVPVTGWCGDLPCRDGEYTVNVRLTDADGQVLDLAPQPLLVDGTPPTSSLTTPSQANATRRNGAEGLIVSWTSHDALSEVASVTALRLSPTGSFPADCSAEKPCSESGTAIGAATFRGISSGTTHHFLTVAVDALGNSESPCQGVEVFPACPTAKFAANASALAKVDVDFLPPSVLDLSAVPLIARPGVNVTLSASVIDDEGGLAGAFVSAGELLPRTEMTEVAGRHVAVVKFPPHAAPGGEETPYVYTVQAGDVAGNANSGQRMSAMLDSKPPRLTVLQPTYRNGADEVPRGRPGAIAQYVVFAEDHKTASVTIDATPIGLSSIDCGDEAAGRRWRCAVPIQNGTDDGVYTLTLNATDAAGNSALLDVDLDVDSLPPEIFNVTVKAIAPDILEITWDTKTPTLGYVQYGLTSALGRQTEPDETRTPHHAVRVTGLNPAEKYHLRPVAVSEANSANLTAPILTQMTPSAFGISFSQFEPGQQWAKTQPVRVAVDLLLDPTQPASVLLKVQDAARLSSPLPVDGGTVGAGMHTFSVDTTLLPDGEYVAIAEASRQGDIVRAESPATFRVDNTPPAIQPLAPRPGKTVGTTLPVLELAVIDPLRTDAPPLSRLTLVLDENATTPGSVAYTGFLGAQRKLAIQLPPSLELADGLHTAIVRMEDGAGNSGTVEWAFVVDSSLPTVETLSLRYAPGAAQGRPAGPGHAWLRLEDLSGVSAASIDLRPWGGANQPLFGHANGTWSGAFTIPPGIPEGRVDVPVNATDAHGRQGPAGLLSLDIDAQPPTLDVTHMRPVSATALLGKATTDEPSVLTLAAGNRNATGALGTTHDVLLGGLVPGQSYDVVLRAADSAGNVAQMAATLRMPADSEAPGLPANATATPGSGGVLVTWAASADNAGVARYVVTRVQSGAQQAFDVRDALRFLDQGAQPGAVSYRIHAVDVAGLEGPAAQALAFIHAPPALDAASISPSVGPTDEPFVVQVTYRHPAGLEPDAIVLHHAGQSFTLARVPGGDCEQGCMYSARVQLPATSAFERAEPTYLEAIVAGVPTQLALDRPLVTSSGDGFRDGGAKPTPAFPFLLAVAALVAALNRRRGDPR